MPSYWKLKYDIRDTQERKRAARNLKKLRAAIKKLIPSRTTSETLLLGTWNIRDFDSNKFGFGPRLQESFFYIAEIINAFDIIAVQEIHRDLSGFNKLMKILGHNYSFIMSDATDGTGGNSERLGFIYNKRKVSFKGIAGEIVLPPKLLISKADKKLQFSRTPISCLFQGDWFKFMLGTVHIYYGESGKKTEAYKHRVNEIQTIANLLYERSVDEQENYILVGDFNIDQMNENEPAFNALEKSGFTVIKNRAGSNQKQTKYYDQISFVEHKNEVMLEETDCFDREPNGVFQLFDSIFSEDDFADYDPYIKKMMAANIREQRKILKTKQQKLSNETNPTKIDRLNKQIVKVEQKIERIKRQKSDEAYRRKLYVNKWRTFQMSDHLPLWVNLKVDFTDRYLSKI